MLNACFSKKLAVFRLYFGGTFVISWQNSRKFSTVIWIFFDLKKLQPKKIQITAKKNFWASGGDDFVTQSPPPHQKSCSRKVRNTAVGSRNILELMTKVQSKIVRVTAGPVKKQSKKMQKKSRPLIRQIFSWIIFDCKKYCWKYQDKNSSITPPEISRNYSRKKSEAQSKSFGCI